MSKNLHQIHKLILYIEEQCLLAVKSIWNLNISLVLQYTYKYTTKIYNTYTYAVGLVDILYDVHTMDYLKKLTNSLSRTPISGILTGKKYTKQCTTNLVLILYIRNLNI